MNTHTVIRTTSTVFVPLSPLIMEKDATLPSFVFLYALATIHNVHTNKMIDGIRIIVCMCDVLSSCTRVSPKKKKKNMTLRGFETNALKIKKRANINTQAHIIEASASFYAHVYYYIIYCITLYSCRQKSTILLLCKYLYIQSLSSF